MTLRRFFFSIVSAPLVAIACGGSADSGSTSAEADSSCLVVATSYDQSCTTDADCVLVPPGGNTCDPCGDPTISGSYYFFCTEAAINVKDRARYLAALAPGMTAASNGPQGCVSSCPVPAPAKCVQGSCAMASPSAGGDGGS